ncbi:MULTISPECIES: hypothetical protein [unclassified Myxococcus]|uniref:hypothetical protein n=1 Tax=unclassified Myxococcus TaxID=2648731 RepID=UPI001C3C4491|nr:MULTISPECIES: hypothetical protein [unclassified Myxococcus]
MDTRALTERLTIATPCAMRWEDMKGDARVRHCGACRLSVHNLSEMTTLEVEALLQPGGNVCARLYRRPDGTVVTGDCRRIWSQQREEAATLLGTAVTVTAAFSFIVVIGLLTLTLYGDHLRRMFGTATAGALLPTPPAASRSSTPAGGTGNHD